MGKIQIYIILFVLLLGTPQVLLGQVPCGDCACIIDRARQAADNLDFQMALRQYNAAKLCDTVLTNSVDEAIVDLFERIQKLKEKAEDDERKAAKALADMKIAEGKMVVAQDSLKTALSAAEVARATAESARAVAELAEKKAKELARIAESRSTINEMNKLILDKRHHEAQDTLESAKNRNVLESTAITNINELLKNSGERLLWRIADIQLPENRGIYLSPKLAILVIDSSGQAQIISNVTGQSLSTISPGSTYLGGAFSQSGKKIALYNNNLVHQFDFSTSNDTTFRYSHKKTFRNQHADIRGGQFSEDDSLYILTNTAFFSFSEPDLPIYTNNQKILDLEPAIVLSEQNHKRKRKRKKGTMLRKAIITLGKDSLMEKRLVFSKRTRAGTYVAKDLPIKVTGQTPKQLLFGPNQQFLVADEGTYLDFRGRIIAYFARWKGSAEIYQHSSRGNIFELTLEDNSTDDFYIANSLNRIITRNQNVLTVRKLDGWKEITLSLPKGQNISGFDLIPKGDINPTLPDEEIPKNYSLLTYTDTNLSIWDWSNQNLISQAKISFGQIKDVIVSVRGNYILLTTKDNRVELWKIGSYKDFQDQDLTHTITDDENKSGN